MCSFVLQTPKVRNPSQRLSIPCHQVSQQILSWHRTDINQSPGSVLLVWPGPGGWAKAAPCCSGMPGPQAWPHMPKVLCPPQLLSAASLFQLDALQRHCEILCSQTLSVESAVNTYKYAKVRTSDAPSAPSRLGNAGTWACRAHLRSPLPGGATCGVGDQHGSQVWGLSQIQSTGPWFSPQPVIFPHLSKWHDHLLRLKSYI